MNDAIDPRNGGDGGVALQGETWNEAVFDDLAALIGPPKAEAILARFRADLARRFADTDRETLRRDAHAVTSMSGMLGFQGLSALAKTLEIQCRDGGDVAPHLSAFMQARQAVTARLEARGGPV